MDILLPYKWIKEYLKTDLDVEEFAKGMSLGGPSIEKWHYDEKLEDHILHIEVTTNRVDMASIVGIAREGRAILSLQGTGKKPELSYSRSSTLPLEVEVLEKEKCPRYQAVVIQNVEVKESPEWLKKRLEACEINSINNLVDITNYVLLEYGKPTHVFDYEQISGSKITVRKAHAGENFTALSGSEHKLNESNLVIADTEKVLALAGVIGGKNSAVNKNTKHIVIESANFEPTSTRKTAREMNLQTDASSLFEKGLNSQSTESAIERVIELVLELAGGEVVSEVIDVTASEFKPNIINFNPLLVKRILGVELSNTEIIETLNRLEFKCTEESGIIRIEVPYFRTEDIVLDYDIVEEVARIYGYDKIPSILPQGEIPVVSLPQNLIWEQKIKEMLAGIGLNEAFSYSMISDKHLKIAGVNPEQTLELLNPLTSDFVYMKIELASEMILTAANNEDYVEKLKLFELNQVFIPDQNNRLPLEQNNLVIVINSSTSDKAFYELKGIWEYILKSIGIDLRSMEYLENNTSKIYKKGASAQIKTQDLILGEIGVVSDHARNISGIKKHTAILEINFDKFFDIIQKTVKSYEPIPKYPAVQRDFAFVLDRKILWKDINRVVVQSSGELYKDSQLFDTYEGTGIPEGKKSIAFRLTLQSSEKTLTEEEISSVVENVTKSVAEKFAAEIR
jgi:phenylalanyl-tRNA synthetase beta chain